MAIVVALLPSCSGGEGARNYTVPESLCGIDIDAELYKSILPPGDDLEVDDAITRDPDGFTTATGNCGVDVDGADALALSTLPTERADSVASVINERGYTLNVEESERLKGSEYETRIWEDEAMAFVGCSRSDFDNTGILISIRAAWAQDEDLSETLRQVIEPYVEARLAEIDPEQCTPA